MALYWPRERIALDIIDDPQRRPFNGDESYTVIYVTMKDISDEKSFEKVRAAMREVLVERANAETGDADECDAISFTDLMTFDGPCVPDPDWLDDEVPDRVDNEPESVQILARNVLEGQMMAESARENGQEVRGITVWSGPVPEGSYERISAGVRMSTPEYFFMRKANELPFHQAAMLGLELCGKYRTSLTQYDREEGYDFLRTTRTSKARIRKYLRGAGDTKEGLRARRVLDMVQDNCGTPLASYLYLMLCLPLGKGGYGLDRPDLSVVLRDGDGFLPTSSSNFIAFDLCWRNQGVVVQYIGAQVPLDDVARANLGGGSFSVICVDDAQLKDPAGLDGIARQVASALGCGLPDSSDDWQRAHERLLSQMSVPVFDHMRLTVDDIACHLVTA